MQNSRSIAKDRISNLHQFLPPYLKKRNRRLKMIHGTMHDNSSKFSSPYGYMEFLKKVRNENEFPGEKFNDQKHLKKNINSILNPFFNDSDRVVKLNHKFSKSRFKPESGIMQKSNKNHL